MTGVRIIDDPKSIDMLSLMLPAVVFIALNLTAMWEYYWRIHS